MWRACEAVVRIVIFHPLDEIITIIIYITESLGKVRADLDTATSVDSCLEEV